VLRSLEILELLAGLESPMSLAQIAKEIDIPKTSCLGLLRALRAHEFVRQDESGCYGLGVRSFEVGAAYLRSMTPTRAAAGELRALTELLGMTSHFAILDGDEVVYLAKHDPPGSGIRLASALGARLPARTTAVGQAQLAFTRRDGSLAAVRARGYAVDEGQTAAGIRCVAAPVFDTSGCCGAVGVSYLSQGETDVTSVAAAIMAAARRATAELGGRWQSEPEPAAPQPGQPEPGQSDQPEPGQPEPGQPEPGQPEPGQPDQPEPGQPEPGQSDQPEPSQPEPGQPRPGTPRPGGERPAGKRPAGKRPAGKRPAGKRPGGERPGGERPGGERR
jgi:DNA-binding IclR family transcriptional regulator